MGGLLDTGALTEKVGGRPGWQWVVAGGAGLALLLYLKSRGASSAAVQNPGQLMLNPALDFGGGGGGSGGGSTPPPPPPPAPAPHDYGTCVEQNPLVGFTPGSKGGSYSGAHSLGFWDCLLGGVTNCDSVSGQTRSYCTAFHGGNFRGIGLGPDGCLYYYNPITGAKSTVTPGCGSAAAGASSAARAPNGAAHAVFAPLHTTPVHPANITPAR